MKNIYKRIKLSKRRGSVFAYMLIIFLVIAIISSTVAILFTSNLRMATHQEESLRAHYLALSGIDVTISTLLSRVIIEDGKELTMAEKITKDNTSIQLKDEIDIEGEIVEIKVDFDKDKKNFTINSRVHTKKNLTKELSLELTLSGKQYKKRWN